MQHVKEEIAFLELLPVLDLMAVGIPLSSYSSIVY
jgi:hypothetical protein